MSIDATVLAQELIRCPSVTPEDAGALDVLQKALESLGFAVRRYVFEEEGTAPVHNLYARWGEGAPNFCFAGHTDVVPVGDAASWTVEPFGAEVIDGQLYGRGATDMKSAIACFVAAAAQAIEGGEVQGSISLLITGDEEGVAINGTQKLLRAIADEGETLTHCLVGEPTNPTKLGEMAKIGRRGSLGGTLVVRGQQGHVAYPHLADNPVPKLVRLLAALDAISFDEGTAEFQPSNLEITSIDVGNSATNVIPAEARAMFNVRFNALHSPDDVWGAIRATLDAEGVAYELNDWVSGDSFITPAGRLSDLVVAACEKVLDCTPALSTTGGTSDARFIKDYCPTIEFGLISQTMHKLDERAAVKDIEALRDIYAHILRGYFATA